VSEDQGEQDPPGLTPEQHEQFEKALGRAGQALGRMSRVGCLGYLFRTFFRSFFRFPRIRRRNLAKVGIGLLIMVSSLVTCSAGVNLTNLTAEYGDPVPASVSAARRFVERAARAFQSGTSSRSFRITVSEVEATSALSLGLMIPELTMAMDSAPPATFQRTDDIGQLRRALREQRKARLAGRSFREKLATLFDPDIHTGDVQVHFTGNGEIVMAGYVEAWRWRQPALVVFAPRARSGELQLNFLSGKLGRLPAPAFAFNALGDLAASLILQGRDYAEISNLTVSDGRLTFEVRITR
jgi:hypothetical protein